MMDGTIRKMLMVLGVYCAMQAAVPADLPAVRLAGEDGSVTTAAPPDTPAPEVPAKGPEPQKRPSAPPVVEQQDQPAVEKRPLPATRPKPAPARAATPPAQPAPPVRAATPPPPSPPLPATMPAVPSPPAPPVTVAPSPPPTPPEPARPAAVADLPKTPPPPSGAPEPAVPLPVTPESAVSPPAPVDAPKPAKDTRYVTIDFDNVDLQVFVKFVSELTGKNFIIDDKVRGKVTIISPRKISVDEVYKVFESVLEVNALAAVPSGDVIKILPSLQAREKQLETRIDRGGNNLEDKLVTQIISLEHANPDEVKRVLDPLIARTSIVLSYPPTGMLVITDYLSNIKKLLDVVSALDVEGVAAQISYIPLAHASAAEIVKSTVALFQPQPGRVTLSPVRMVADERSNAVIVVAREMDAERIKRLLTFMDKEVPREAATLRVYRLQNAVAEDLAKVLMNIPKETRAPTPPGAPPLPAVDQRGRSPMLSKDVQVLADKATNTLIITANNDDYRILEEVIKNLDVPRPMVFIEALVMEVSSSKNFQVGVEWRGLFGSAAMSNLGASATAVGMGGFTGAPIIPQVDRSTGLPSFPGGFSVGVVGAGINIGGVLFPNIGAVIQAYQKDSDVSILSTPQIMTLDNEEAEIKVVENVPFISRQENPSGTTTGFNYSTYEYKDVGTTLTITPIINEEDFIRLRINQKVNQVTKEEAGRPTTLNREAKTTVVVKDRETIVIGGLLKDNTNLTNYGVPCLADIPIFGWLFKSAASGREKTNLFVFITPHIIRTQKDAAKLLRDKKQEMGAFQEGVIKLNERPLPGRSGDGW